MVWVINILELLFVPSHDTIFVIYHFISPEQVSDNSEINKERKALPISLILLMSRFTTLEFSYVDNPSYSVK